MKKIENKWINYIICGLILILGYKIIDNYEKVINFLKGIAGEFLPVVAGIIIAFFTRGKYKSFLHRKSGGRNW